MPLREAAKLKISKPIIALIANLILIGCKNPTAADAKRGPDDAGVLHAQDPNRPREPTCDKEPTLPSPWIGVPSLDWHAGSIPRDISSSKAFQNWKASLLDPEWPIRYAWIDRSGDNRIVILQETVGGTGGWNSGILIRVKNKWKETISFQGGWAMKTDARGDRMLRLFLRMGADRETHLCRLNNWDHKFHCQENEWVTYFDAVDSGYSKKDRYWWDFFWYTNTGCWRTEKANRNTKIWFGK